MDVAFVPGDFNVPLVLKTDFFRLEPIKPEHYERDYRAWMSSIEHIRSTPGYSSGRWPCEMSLEKNLKELERHAEDFIQRRGFTYSVLNGDDIVGAVYIYPTKKVGYDAMAKSWVTASRAELDSILREAISIWLVEDWPFESVHYDLH